MPSLPNQAPFAQLHPFVALTNKATINNLKRVILYMRQYIHVIESQKYNSQIIYFRLFASVKMKILEVNLVVVSLA